MSKFANDADEYVYELTLDGSYASTGSIDWHYWVCLVDFDREDCETISLKADGLEKMVSAIVREDTQGFIEVDYYEDDSKAMRDFAQYDNDYRKYMLD